MRYYALVTFRYATLALALLSTACALPVEEHGGVAPRPEPSDLTFMATGAAINTAGLLVHAPAWVRVGADAVAVWALRFPKWGGRYEGVALTLPVGAFVPEWAHTLIHGLKYPSHPSCTMSRGPDTAVTQPVAARELKGQRWGNDCLTWEEVRRLRHQY